MKTDPANNIQDLLIFGEFGGVNPSITDSSTFTFLTAEKMEEIFEHEIEGCYLYSRHINPSIEFLSRALALLEGTEASQPTASGMPAIACAILQICSAGDEIISSRTIYGGSYAIMKNFFPKLGINTTFVPITNLEIIKSKITPKTKVLYCETISNPLLEVADIRKLAELCKQHDIKLIVDNTFSPMLIRPHDFGADIVIHSLTKYINGASDTVGGVICASKEFIGSLKDVSNGATMLLGPTMDSLRAQSIFKNIRTLHIRMHQHSKNGMYIATKLRELGVRIYYTGFEDHPQHELMKSMLTPGYGFGGMITIDVGTTELSNQLMVRMQENLVGYFAVSLGFYKTLFSSPGHSTSSEIPEEERAAMGLTDGLVRFSVGLDNDIERSFERIKKSLVEIGIVKL